MADDPKWARGFDVAWLKECARIFAVEFKPHSYGAFGVPKERDVADAHAENCVAWTRDGAGVDAVALFRALAMPSAHSDFAGRQASMRAGDLFVRAIAGPRRHNLLLKLMARAEKAPAIWVEGHVENPDFVQLVADFNFQFVMTKISASSDLKGLWVKGAKDGGRLPPALEDADKIGLGIIKQPYLTQKMHTAICAELSLLEPGAWAQHYSAYNKRKSWTSFALIGYQPNDPHFIIKPAEMSKDWKEKNLELLEAKCAPTIAAKQFPNLMKVVAELPGEKQRVRLMRLGASIGELTRHSDITDREAGTELGKIARLHIPITSDERCLFRSWNLAGQEKRAHLPERCLAYLDVRKPHAVINPSDVERVHLVVDVRVDSAVRDLILRAT